MEYCLGIDTSNYTTSLAAVPVSGGELYSVRRLLATPEKQVGVRQSDAHFLHMKNLPELFSQLREQLPPDATFVRVGVSTRPRGVEGSYMPCFLAGVTAAHAAAFSASAQVFETSHQEGHLAAALYGCPQFPVRDRFYAMHLSGGTMELLEVTTASSGYDVKLKLATLDVTAGQLVDRIGVLMGLQFPCGRALDAMALCSKKRLPNLPLRLKEGGINLSGVENRAKTYLDAGESLEDVAAFVFAQIARAISALLDEADGNLPLLLCGGVSASAYLKRALTDERIFFTDPSLATDNAVGVALLTREKGGNLR